MEGNQLCEQVHCLNPFLLPHQASQTETKLANS